MRILLAFLLMLVSSIYAVAYACSLPPDIAGIVARGKLVVAVLHKDLPPFFSEDQNGRLTGYSIDLATDMAYQLGVKVEFDRSAQNIEDVVKEVACGKADVGISLLSRTPSRAMYVRFSEPYLILRQTLLINRLFVAKKQFLAGEQSWLSQRGEIKVGIMSSNAYQQYVQEDFPKAKIIFYSSEADAFADVAQGRIDAALSDQVQVAYWLSHHPAAHLDAQMLVLRDKIDPIAMIVPWGSPHLYEWIQVYLATMREKGTLNKLAQQYGIPANAVSLTNFPH